MKPLKEIRMILLTKIKEFIKHKKWAITAFFIVFIICIILLFSFNCDSKTYEERFLTMAMKKFGNSNAKPMNIGMSQPFLKGHVIISYNKKKNNKFYFDIEYPRSKRSESIWMDANDRHDFSLRFKPVDVQYTITLKEENNNDLNLYIALNEEYTRSAIKRTKTGEPGHTSPGRNTNSILNILISLFTSVLGSLAASRIEERQKKPKKRKPKRK